MEKLFPKDAIWMLGLIWLVFVVDLLLPGFTFNVFGIRPRELTGLPGIFTSPFLHGGLGHILSNSISLIGTAMLVRLAVGSKLLRRIMIFGAIGAGAGAWLFSSGGIVVGASGMIYALIGFLFAQAFFNPTLRSWLSAILSLIFFGGALLSFFNFMPYISWSAHFWGFVSGIGLAYLYRPRAESSGGTSPKSGI